MPSDTTFVSETSADVFFKRFGPSASSMLAHLPVTKAGLLKMLGKKSLPVVGGAYAVYQSGSLAIEDASQGQYANAAGAIINGAVAFTLPWPLEMGYMYEQYLIATQGEANFARQHLLNDTLGQTAKEFKTLTDQGFGLYPTPPATERQLAIYMHALNDQFHQDIARPDEFKRTIELMHKTTEGLASYLESSIAAGGPDAARLQNYITQTLGYKSVPEYVKHLHEIAGQYSMENIVRQDSLKNLFGGTVQAFDALKSNGFGTEPTAPTAEKELASAMASLNDDVLQRKTANADEFIETRKLVHETATHLADYFDSSANGSQVTRLQKYATALGFDDVADLVHELRGLADNTKPSPPNPLRLGLNDSTALSPSGVHNVERRCAASMNADSAMLPKIETSSNSQTVIASTKSSTSPGFTVS